VTQSGKADWGLNLTGCCPNPRNLMVIDDLHLCKT
jgi:hypothetical protein